MKANVLWVDDKPEGSELFRRCVIERGIDLYVATSLFEATHAVNTLNYDLVYMKPDLRLEGNVTICVEERQRRNEKTPFAKRFLSAMRDGNYNEQTPLYFFSFSNQFDEEAGQLRNALEAEGINIDKDLTRLVHLYDCKPSAFGYDVHQDILQRELGKLKADRASSRVDG